MKKDAKGVTTALVSFGLPKECPIPKVLFLIVYFSILTLITTIGFDT